MIRLTHDEVQKVLRLAAAKGIISPTAGPTADTVANAFGLQPWQVERLLTEVRESDAEAPEWRKLRMLGAVAAVLALLGLSFTAWQSRSSGSTTVADGSAPSSAGLTPPNEQFGFATTSPGQPYSAPVPQSSVAASSRTGAEIEGQPLRHKVSADSEFGEPVLARNVHVKTEESDLNNSRARAGRPGSRVDDHGPKSMRNSAGVSGR